MCKSGRGGGLHERGVALLDIPLFLRGGSLREILFKDMAVVDTRGGLHERIRYIASGNLSRT